MVLYLQFPRQVRLGAAQVSGAEYFLSTVVKFLPKPLDKPQGFYYYNNNEDKIARIKM